MSCIHRGAKAGVMLLRVCIERINLKVVIIKLYEGYMTNTLLPFGMDMDAPDAKNLLNLPEFTPLAPELTDMRVSKIGAGAMAAGSGDELAPFGTALGIAVPEPMETGNTGAGGTSPKGNGNFDDYET
jgi:hypothetical protein